MATITAAKQARNYVLKKYPTACLLQAVGEPWYRIGVTDSDTNDVLYLTGELATQSDCWCGAATGLHRLQMASEFSVHILAESKLRDAQRARYPVVVVDGYYRRNIEQSPGVRTCLHSVMLNNLCVTCPGYARKLSYLTAASLGLLHWLQEGDTEMRYSLSAKQIKTLLTSRILTLLRIKANMHSGNLQQLQSFCRQPPRTAAAAEVLSWLSIELTATQWTLLYQLATTV